MSGAPIDTMITVRRDGSRLIVTIARGRKPRLVSLSMDEAAILAAELQRHLPMVTVTRRDGA
jgi:hypothetical protein